MDTTAFERFYSKIFTIPKKRISVTLGVVTIALASLLHGSYRPFFAQRYFFLGLLFIVLILAVGRTINLAFNGRRVFFLAFLLLLFIEVVDFIACSLGFRHLVALTPAVISSFLTIILYFSSEADEWSVYLVSLGMVLLLYPFSYLSYDLSLAPSIPFGMLELSAGYGFIALAGVGAGHAYLSFLDTDQGFNVKSFFRAFLLFWLTHNPRYFEDRLNEVATRMQGWVRCLSIGDVRLIANAFHPGPLRNVGGARLVHRVLEQPGAMYLHSASTHDRNLVSGADVDEVIQNISCGDRELQAHHPFSIDGDEFTVTAFPFDAFTLMVVSGIQAIDDLPPEVQEYADNLGEILIVDAHNAYRKDYDVTPAQVEEIKSLIRRAAGIETANALIVTVTDDTEAIFITLLARDLNPDLEIVVRANEAENRSKLVAAGADYVLPIATVSARMLAGTIMGEEIISYETQIEIVRTAAPNFAGKTVGAAEVGERTGCTILAVERDGETHSEIDADFELRRDDALVVAGTDAGVERFRALAGTPTT